MENNKLAELRHKIDTNTLNVDEVFLSLIDLLNFKHSDNFRMFSNQYNKDCRVDIDGEYKIETHSEVHSLILFKKFDSIDENEIDKIHRQYWNLNKAPISIIVFPNEIRVYNNFTLNNNNKLICSSRDKLGLEKLVEYSETNILSGFVWEKLHKDLKKIDRVDKKLLNNLRELLERLHKEYNMRYSVAHSFIARCIFIKYLEDRGALTDSFFDNYDVKSFTELLFLNDLNKIKLFFIEMKNRFNGDLFRFSESEDFITKEQLELVYDFFKGTELATGQQSFFPYDFSIIPIELISNIYETFLDLDDKKKDGTFYTPYFLADFVLKHTFDEKFENMDLENIKILDPACGSGIFLVESFKKIAELYKKRYGKVESENLKHILENNLFGIDINDEALKIACFSLYIALLDYLEPKDILRNNFKFPKLIGSNLVCADFFNTSADFNNLKFTYIIGNPPWVSTKSSSEIPLHEKYFTEQKIPVSDNQTAQTFIARAKDFATADTKITFIVSSRIFFNHYAYDFRQYLLKTMKIDYVIDLSIAKNNIFGSAAAPCSIISYGLSENNDSNVISYYSFKPNCFTKLLKKIVIEPSEIIKIEQKLLKKYDYLWRVVLFGTEFDFSLIRKMKNNRRLGEFAELNKFVFGQGYAKGNGKDEYPELNDMHVVEPGKHIYRYYIDYKNTSMVETTKFERLHQKEIYYAPHLLIKRTIPSDTFRCVSALMWEDALFPNTIFSIASKENNEDKVNLLRYLEAIINSKLCSYYHFHTSGGWGIFIPEVIMYEHKDFPLVFPEKNPVLYDEIVSCVKRMEIINGLLYNKLEENNDSILNDVEIENQIDELRYELDNIQVSIDNKVFELYSLNEIEKETVEYTFSILMNLFKERDSKTMNTEALRFAVKDDFSSYAKRVIDHFNSILNHNNLYVRVQVFESTFFVSMNFIIEECDQKQDSEISFENNFVNQFFQYLGVCSISEVANNVYIQRIIRGFSPNSFYIIKTKERKNWMNMNATLDINEFTKDIFST